MSYIKIFYTLILAGAACAAAPGAQAQNLIVNSNFSTGDFTGWTVTETGTAGNPRDYGVTSTYDGGVRVPRPGDTDGAFFNPNGGTMDLSQTVDLSAAGTYTISGAVEPVFNDVDVFTILLDGTPLLTTNFEVSSPYVPFSVTVAATAGSHVVDFEFTPGSGPMFFDDAGMVADEVVTPPPVVTPAALLGSAADGAVIGLKGAPIVNFFSAIDGDVYVSQYGELDNFPFSVITGNVVEFNARQYNGRGRVEGTVGTNSTLLAAVDTDALSASTNIAAMTPTQSSGSVRRNTVVTGNGGVNVIDINGDITASLVLSGTSNDVFFVNVAGSIRLRDRATLGVANGVTPDNVIYNLIGRGAVETDFGDVVNGTILAPGYDIDLSGEINGGVIGGGNGRAITLFGAVVN